MSDPRTNQLSRLSPDQGSLGELLDELDGSGSDADYLVDCPRCGGFPDFDEEGNSYTCFFCCDEGRVFKSIADEEERLANEMAAERDAKEAEKRKRLEIPDGYGYYIDEVDGEVVLIPPRPAPGSTPTSFMDDDLPF